MNNNSSRTTKTARNRRRRIARKAKRKAGAPGPKGPGRRPRGQNRGPSSNLQPGVRLSKCTEMYAKALINPFGAHSTLPCIPDVVILPTHKFMCRCRGTLSTGTLGTGFALFNPWMMIANDRAVTVAQIAFPVVSTTSLYAGATVIAIGATGAISTTGVAGSNSNSMFTSAFVGLGDKEYRLVAAGIRVRYIGTDFSNQGRLVLYRQQGNGAIPITGVVNASNFLQDDYAVSVPISRKSEYIYYIPDGAQLLSFQSDSFFNTGNLYQYIIWIDGGSTATPQSWEFEAVSYFEMTGSTLPLTKSEADPVGFAGVLGSLLSKAPSGTPATEQAGLFSRIGKTILGETTAYFLGNSSGIGGAAMQIAGSMIRATRGTRQPSQMVTIEDADD